MRKPRKSGNAFGASTKNYSQPRALRVELYLLSRGLTLQPEHDLKYHPRLWHDTNRSAWPAMVATVRDVDGYCDRHSSNLLTL